MSRQISTADWTHDVRPPQLSKSLSLTNGRDPGSRVTHVVASFSWLGLLQILRRSDASQAGRFFRASVGGLQGRFGWAPCHIRARPIGGPSKCDEAESAARKHYKPGALETARRDEAAHHLMHRRELIGAHLMREAISEGISEVNRDAIRGHQMPSDAIEVIGRHRTPSDASQLLLQKASPLCSDEGGKQWRSHLLIGRAVLSRLPRGKPRML